MKKRKIKNYWGKGALKRLQESILTTNLEFLNKFFIIPSISTKRSSKNHQLNQM